VLVQAPHNCPSAGSEAGVRGGLGPLNKAETYSFFDALRSSKGAETEVSIVSDRQKDDANAVSPMQSYNGRGGQDCAASKRSWLGGI
jgi:hypothetical protein